MKFSVVVPIYNERDNIKALDTELRSVMKKMGTFEIIYVNDGSRDGSLEELYKLKGCTIIDLQRNYGQSVALDAGFKRAIGEYVISLDGDMQNDPHDLPAMFAMLQRENLDVVAGWRTKRKDPLWMRIVTRCARLLRKQFVNDGVHDSGCTLRIYTRQAVSTLDLWGEMHRYIIALLKWKGFRVGEMKVNHRPRGSGTTKYTSIKAVNGFTDLVFMWFINKYSRRPLHFFGALSMIMILLGTLIEAWMAYMKLVYGVSLSDNAFFPLGFFMIILGIQLFISGVMIDVMLRTYYNGSRYESRYIVKEIIKR